MVGTVQGIHPLSLITYAFMVLVYNMIKLRVHGIEKYQLLNIFLGSAQISTKIVGVPVHSAMTNEEQKC